MRNNIKYLIHNQMGWCGYVSNLLREKCGNLAGEKSKANFKGKNLKLNIEFWLIESWNLFVMWSAKGGLIIGIAPYGY